MAKNKSQILQESIRRLIRREAYTHLKKILQKAHPSEIAEAVRVQPAETGLKIYRLLPSAELQAKVISELGGHFLKVLVDAEESLQSTAGVLQLLPDDEVATLLDELPQEVSDEILHLLRDTTQAEINEILQYDEGTCGRIMSVDVFALPQDLSVQEAISRIQTGSHPESLFYLYIVDEFENLVGVLSLRQLLQSDGQKKLSEIMSREVVSVNAYQSQDDAARIVDSYNYVSLPVIDKQGKLAGMITVDDVIDLIRGEAQEEMLQMAGVESSAIDEESIPRLFLSRMVWFMLFFAGGIACAEIINKYFAPIPMQYVGLCFLPMVLRLGGSSAIQSVTLVSEGVLNTSNVRSHSWRVFSLQVSVTLFTAIFFCAALAFYSAMRFHGDFRLGIMLGSGLLAAGVTATLVGVALPMLFQALRFDIIKSSSRVIHLGMDALSLGVYLFVLYRWS